jgi:arginine N-succinyltransferase
MFLLRSVRESDLNDLYELSQLLVFINLPPDRDILAQKIALSLKTFEQPSDVLENNYYIFVLEDLEQSKVIGASMIHGKHGTEEEPHFFLKVSREHKFSKSINTGFIHGTLKFGLETDGWSEVGGLVLSPAYRGNKEKLGKQLSFVRFLFIGLQSQHFTEFIHSELMPPLDSKGNSPLWEAIGRRFLNMDYQDADRLSRQNKEFILSLYPIETIYETLLPPDARNSIGKVGDETKPVKKMLESVGFYYTEEVDPFDGGPHYRARTVDIKPIKTMLRDASLDLNSTPDPTKLKTILLDIPSPTDYFRAVKVEAEVRGKGKELTIIPTKELTDRLKALSAPSKVNAIYL